MNTLSTRTIRQPSLSGRLARHHDRAKLHVLAALLVLPAVLGPLRGATAAEVAPLSRSEFCTETYIAHVRFLASDELEGRAPGTPGIERAAEYIREQFERAGLQPAGVEDGWFQSFRVRRGRQIDRDQARLEIAGVTPAPVLEQDWIPFPFSPGEEVSGPLFFAGYGIEAPDHDFDDYAGFDASGKILLIFRYEPRAADPQAPFGGQSPSEHALFTTKIRLAKQKGAAGVLVVSPPLREPPDNQLYPFEGARIRETYDLPCAHLTAELAERLLHAAGLPDLRTLQEQSDRGTGPRHADLKATVRLAPGTAPVMLTTRNVLGLLPGRQHPALNGNADEADEYVVIGAHYDHLGKVVRQFPGGGGVREPAIHNGADDNASGTSGLLELARVLPFEPRPRRSILFIAFSAEEMGLLGSKHFVDEPTVPLERIRAMVNFDMIGRANQQRLVVYGAHTAQEFSELIERRLGDPRTSGYRLARGLPGNSDHASFQRKGIPVLFPFTGVHRDYHRPSDDWELIDAAGAVSILEAWRPIILELADMKEGPTYTEPRERPSPEDLLKRPAAEEAPAPGGDDARPAPPASPAPGDDAPAPRMPAVRLGIMPDYAGDDEPGLIVEQVTPTGAAKAAGMLDGDRIIRIGDRTVAGIDSYMEALRAFSPGDEIEIEVVRDGQKLVLSVTARGSGQPRGGS